MHFQAVIRASVGSLLWQTFPQDTSELLPMLQIANHERWLLAL